MRHLAAFQASLAVGTTFLNVTAVNDGLLTVAASNRVTLPADGEVEFAYLQSTTMQRGRFNFPQARRLWLPQIRPVTVGVVSGSDPNVASFLRHPLPIVRDQEFGLEAVHGGAGAETVTGFVGLSFPGVPYAYARGQPTAGSFKQRFVGSTTLTANAWTTCALTADDTFPPGYYAIVGVEAFGTTMIAARLIIPGAGPFRPGVIATQTIGQRPHDIFRALQSPLSLDEFGYFYTTALPTLEAFATAADTAQTVTLDLVPVELLSA